MDESFNGIDTAQLEKIMSVVRLVKGLSDMGGDLRTENGNGDDEAGTAGGDGAISVSNETQAINALNAAVPYLDFKYRRPIGIFVKIIEMNKIINSFEVMTADTEDVHKSKERKKRMLLAIRPELDAKKQHMLDIFIRVLEIKDIMEVMSIDTEN